MNLYYYLQLSQPGPYIQNVIIFQIQGRNSVFDKMKDLQSHDTHKSLFRLVFKVKTNFQHKGQYFCAYLIKLTHL